MHVCCCWWILGTLRLLLLTPYSCWYPYKPQHTTSPLNWLQNGKSHPTTSMIRSNWPSTRQTSGQPLIQYCSCLISQCGWMTYARKQFMRHCMLQACPCSSLYCWLRWCLLTTLLHRFTLLDVNNHFTAVQRYPRSDASHCKPWHYMIHDLTPFSSSPVNMYVGGQTPRFSRSSAHFTCSY